MGGEGVRDMYKKEAKPAGSKQSMSTECWMLVATPTVLVNVVL